MFKSIFRRLIWTYSVIFLLVFIVMFGAMSGFYLNYIGNTQYENAKKASGAIERLTFVLSDNIRSPEAWDFYNTSLYSWSNIVGSDITVIDSDGDVFSSTADIKITPEKITKELLDGKTVRKYTKFGSYYDELIYVIGIPLMYQGEVVGGMFFNTTTGMITLLLQNFFKIFLFSFLISVFFAIILIFFQTKRISKPIADINKAVLGIASGNFDERLPVNTKDETGQLASSFNYMAESLKQLDKMRESFISDVSHELRTPMTSITGFVGGILDGTIPEEKHKEYLKIVYDETNRLTRMTSDMLEMSKMASSEYKLTMQKFDICEAIRLAIISLESKIDKKNLELSVDFAKEQIFVMADKDSIQRVIINLLDNAIKFSFNNTKISISVWTDSACYVKIGNFGIGIEKDDLEHIFDRFYKSDKSRGNDKTGAGLGLSMARNIMNLHRSHIWAESDTLKEGSDVKYTTFTFKLELA